MPSLSKDPTDWQLEDLVAAHFVSRCCFVECGVTHRDPDAVLELDVVWTDYRTNPPRRSPVEVKSKAWSMPDLFKFYGWTRYLGLPPGQFAYRVDPKDQVLADKVCSKTGIELLRVSTPDDVAKGLDSLNLPGPTSPYLPHLWRFSYWIRRRFFESLQEAIRQNICPVSAAKAKDYRNLINDALFFEPDPRERFEKILKAHIRHPKLSATAAAETEGKAVDFDDPPSTPTLSRALYQGAHFPVQACMYDAHHAHLHTIKAAVDYWIAKKAGSLAKIEMKFGSGKDSMVIDLSASGLTPSFLGAVEEFSSEEWFPLLPVFWQVFLWGWGGFLLRDRWEQERAALSIQTGIPETGVLKALTAFDKFFPAKGGWIRDPAMSHRRVISLMPPAVRGIGAYHRLLLNNVEQYRELGYKDNTTSHLIDDNNSAVRLLDAEKTDIVK